MPNFNTLSRILYTIRKLYSCCKDFCRKHKYFPSFFIKLKDKSIKELYFSAFFVEKWNMNYIQKMAWAAQRKKMLNTIFLDPNAGCYFFCRLNYGKVEKWNEKRLFPTRRPSSYHNTKWRKWEVYFEDYSKLSCIN